MFFVHTAQVSTFQGSGPSGDAYADAVTVKGFLDDGVQQIAAPGGGSQIVQQSKFYARLSDADLFTPRTMLAVNGRACVVREVRRRDGGSLGLPSHVEVELV